MPNVPSKILNKVIEYATYHTEQDKKEGDKKDEDKDTTFDTDFVKVDQATLFELILVRRSLWHAIPLTCFVSRRKIAPFVASEKTHLLAPTFVFLDSLRLPTT